MQTRNRNFITQNLAEQPGTRCLGLQSIAATEMSFADEVSAPMPPWLVERGVRRRQLRMTSLMLGSLCFCLTIASGTIDQAANSQNSQDFQPLTSSGKTPGKTSERPIAISKPWQPVARNPETAGENRVPQTSEQSQLPYQMVGRIHLQTGSNRGYLVVQCDLKAGCYIHALTHDPEMNPTRITVQPDGQHRLIGKFYSDRPPIVIEKDPVFDQRVEKHTGQVQFFVPIELTDGFVSETDLRQWQPIMLVDGQVCSDDGTCLPLRKVKVAAEFAGYYQAASTTSTTTSNR